MFPSSSADWYPQRHMGRSLRYPKDCFLSPAWKYLVHCLCNGGERIVFPSLSLKIATCFDALGNVIVWY